MIVRSAARSVVVAAIALAVPLAGAGPAGAHVEIRESDPGDGEVVAEGLDELELQFLAFDPEGPLDVEVTDETGNDVVAGEPEVTARDSSAVVPLDPLEPGEYRVHIHALSSDGDGISELDFAFAVEADTGGGIGVWFLWVVALAIPAAILLRPGARTRAGS